MRIKSIFVVVVISLMFAGSIAISDSGEMKRKIDHFEMVAKTGLYDNVKYSKEEIRRAILKTRGQDSSNPVSSSEIYLSALVDGFYDNGEKYKLPSMLFVGMALKESEYKTDVTGVLGEKGILQVGKQGRNACRKECGEFNMDPGIQICHGYCWFSKIKNKTCDGSIRQGLYGYACGRCEPKAKWRKTIDAVRRRYRLWGWLHVNLGKDI